MSNDSNGNKPTEQAVRIATSVIANDYHDPYAKGATGFNPSKEIIHAVRVLKAAGFGKDQ